MSKFRDHCIFKLYADCRHQKDTSHSFPIAFVIMSQENPYHQSLAESLKASIRNQAAQLFPNTGVKVFMSHEDFQNVYLHWTVYPLFPMLSDLTDSDWLFFLQDHTAVDVGVLLKMVSFYNASESIFAGYALYDSEPAIIHHFASTDQVSIIPYPNFSAGFLMSTSLIKRLRKQCDSCKFAIDPQYELAKFIWNTAAVKLIHEPDICLKRKKKTCASWITDENSRCVGTLAPRKIFVAVKTCQKFHYDRVRVVKNTWAPDVKNLLFFSDKENTSIPTIQLDVENVESGHCDKTRAIVSYYATNNIIPDWLVIVDDDTLLSFSRLRKLLSCYDSSEDVALGERYGYRYSNNLGYDYLTGGSGMIFSRSALKKLAAVFDCPQADSPDDMIIGSTLSLLKIPVTHSSLFHQARPNDYSPDFLSPRKHVSFHKHWMIDPYDVYDHWLQEDDARGHLEL